MVAEERRAGAPERETGQQADLAATPAAQASELDPVCALAAKEEEVRGLIDRLKRLQAEFDNYRKRILRDLAELEQRASDREVLDFLPLYDNLARAFATHAKDGNVEDFVSGVERIFGQFAQILEQKGVCRIKTTGEPFDPSRHEALLCIPSKEPANVIVEEFSPGYTRGERTLQPSKVSVSQGPAPDAKEEV